MTQKPEPRNVDLNPTKIGHVDRIFVTLLILNISKDLAQGEAGIVYGLILINKIDYSCAFTKYLYGSTF